MKFGLFYEHQLPRPWAEGSESRLLTDALDQIELADRVGLDYVWEVEHHFLAEYSHSSAPEVFLGAASQRTRNIRLGHGIVHAPPTVNHPARIAERIATLDLLSGGRVEFGTGEGGSAAELAGFGTPRTDKHDMWAEAVDVITRMFVEDPFCGWSGRYLNMPPRELVPKPVQRPHPPLWMACSRRDSIKVAAANGLGALSFSFIEPEQAAQWVREYYDVIESTACVPGGYAVNPNFAVVLPMMLHATESVAIERGIDGAHFFGFSLAHYYHETHVIGGKPLWEDFQERRAELGFVRDLVKAEGAALAVRVVEEGMGSLRGAIGTPAQIRDLISRYEAAGVDQMIFVLQAGNNKHEDICESIELFGKTVLPHFTEGRDAASKAKRERLAEAVERALARRAAPRVLAEPYPIAEAAELEAHQQWAATS
jgi:alkanesulfonate monooxygenase SsuD/methylene tetrahydromethanopterin reductase-like flavin-dependent oxidoreductase (luciferase family)